MFSIAIVFLGLSAARLRRVARARRSAQGDVRLGAAASAADSQVAALGVALHQFWLLLLGYGVIGGIGLGLGYISPVSTLIKWFPDRPGMATGMAIMGFGGGAMIASPLSTTLMAHFKTATSPGVARDVRRDGHPLLLLHDVRRVHRARAAVRAGSRQGGRAPAAARAW